MTENLTNRPENLPPPEVWLDNDFFLRQILPSDSQAMFALIDRNRDHLSQNGDVTSANYPTLESVVARNESQSDNELRFGIWEFHYNNPDAPVDASFLEKHKPTNVLVGFIKLTQKPDEPVEIGYYLDGTQQGRGIMAKSVRAVTIMALDSLGKDSVIAKVAVTNQGSLNVLQKAGYKIVDQDEDHYTLEYAEADSLPVFRSEVKDPHYFNPDDYSQIQEELSDVASSLGFSEDEVVFSGWTRLQPPRIASSTHFGDITILNSPMPAREQANPISFALKRPYGVISIYDRSLLELNDGGVNSDRGAWVGAWVVRNGREKVGRAKIGELRLANQLDLPDLE